MNIAKQKKYYCIINEYNEVFASHPGNGPQAADIYSNKKLALKGAAMWSSLLHKYSVVEVTFGKKVKK